MNKLFLIFFISLFVFSTSQAADLIQENEKGEFSAHLDKVKLSELTKFIEKKHGIRFKGPDTQLQTPITLSFEKLTLEQMLKKILTRINYVFTFDKSGKVTEVALLPTSSNKAGAVSNYNTAKNNPPPMPTAVPQGDNVGPETISNFPAQNSAADEITSFKIQPNAPPPGMEQGNSKVNGPDEITSFKVIRNAPPPGN